MFERLISEAMSFYQSYPFAVYVGASAYLLLFIFKRKAALQVLVLLLFAVGVFMVVSQFGQSLDTGIQNKQSMSNKTEKALK